MFNGLWSYDEITFNERDLLNEDFKDEIYTAKLHIKYFGKNLSDLNFTELLRENFGELIIKEEESIQNVYNGYPSLFIANNFFHIADKNITLKEKLAIISLVIICLIKEIEEHIIEFQSERIYSREAICHTKAITKLTIMVDELLLNSYHEYVEAIEETSINSSKEKKEKAAIFLEPTKEDYIKLFCRNKGNEKINNIDLINFYEAHELGTQNQIIENYIEKLITEDKKSTKEVYQKSFKTNIENKLREYCEWMFKSQLRKKFYDTKAINLKELSEQIYEYRLNINSEEFTLDRKYIIANSKRKKDSINKIYAIINDAINSEF